MRPLNAPRAPESSQPTVAAENGQNTRASLGRAEATLKVKVHLGPLLGAFVGGEVRREINDYTRGRSERNKNRSSVAS